MHVQSQHVIELGHALTQCTNDAQAAGAVGLLLADGALGLEELADSLDRVHISKDLHIERHELVWRVLDNYFERVFSRAASMADP